MKLVATAGKMGGATLRFIGDAWRRAWCALANLRRRLFHGRLPDYVVITLDQEIEERTPEHPWWMSYIPGRKEPISLEWLAEVLERIAGDPTVRGVVFLVKSPSLSLSQAQSLAALLRRFRQWDQAYNQPEPKDVKQVIFHLEQVSIPTYVAACGANYIYMAPLTTWDILGLRSTPTFFKETLARLGVTVDVVRVSPWKSAADMVSEAAMSPEQEAQLNWLLDSWYADIVQAIQQGRRLEPEEVTELIDGAPWSAMEATENNLIDTMAYEDEIATLLGDGVNPATLKPYHRVRSLLWRHPRRYHPKRIGVITLQGTIVSGASRSQPIPLPLIGSQTLGSATAQQQIRAARQDEQIAAVVVHVDSPGGSALASDIIWRELELLNQEKPVVIYMGGVAASGGYYIAAPGRKIVAQRATLTGSIGVVMAKAVTTGAYEKIGAHRQQVQRGANADLYDDLHGWSGAQRAKVEAGVSQIYTAFKERVAAGRKLPLANLDEIANGRVWTGAQALERGLVDTLGDFACAVEAACTLADLPTDGSVRTEGISAGKESLLAKPLAEVTMLLGLDLLQQTKQLTSQALTGEWNTLLRGDPYWLIADGLPRLD
ncbi:MAG: signal peptide peptidase SppA [Caldilineaceae bacterium]